MNLELLILSYAKLFKVSGPLLLAICMHETGLKNVKVPHDGGSPTFGVCQVKYDTAKMLGYTGKAEGLMVPKENVKWAAKYLKYQLDRYDNDHCKSVAAYNAGTYFESKSAPGKPTNLKYVKKVQNKLDEDLKRSLSCD